MSESPDTTDSADDMPRIPEMEALWGHGTKGDKGDRGAKGDKGDKGDKGNKGLKGPEGVIGESKLAAAAEAEVTRLVKAKSVPRWWGKAFIALFIVVGIIAGYLLFQNITHPITNQLRADIAANQALGTSDRAYTDQVVQHECASLELLTAVPVLKPADPAKNPSRETTYQFYVALLAWEHKDGCKIVSVPVAHG